MPYCSKCGAQVADFSAFCPQCGQAQAGVKAGAPVAVSGTQSGLSENAAALLSYVLGWLTGLIFIVIDKRPYVRFHAAQSIVVFGGLHILSAVLGVVFGVRWLFGGWVGWRSLGPGLALHTVLRLFGFVLWVVLMIKAYQGERFKVPIAGGIAEDLAGGK